MEGTRTDHFDRGPRLVVPEPAIWRLTAPNPGVKTLDGTQVYVAGRDPAYIIDPGPAVETHIDELTEWLEDAGVRRGAILLTHGHPDHARAAEPLAERLNLSIWGSSELDASSVNHSRRLRVYAANQSFPLGAETLEVVTTPGHSSDHVGLWLPTSRIFFAGDAVLGKGTTLIQPPEGDMGAYMGTLAFMRTLEPALILPGHGPVIDNPQRVLDAYIAHRLERERQVLRVLHSGPASAEDIARSLYAEIDPGAFDLAVGSVMGTLSKLVNEGRVSRDDDVYRLADS